MFVGHTGFEPDTTLFYELIPLLLNYYGFINNPCSKQRYACAPNKTTLFSRTA